MGSLAVLLLATPIYGFALQAPMVHPALDVSAAAAAQTQSDASPPPVGGDDTGPGGDQDEYVQDMKRRNDLADTHRILGISTWVAMTATVVLGTIAYHNLYGFFDDQGANPCVTGDAIGGDCDNMRAAHAISAGLTTVLYASTFTFALLMPDPDDLSAGNGEFASTLRLHKLLRWVHFGGMLAQALIGIVIANDLLGLDRANDYGALQTLATVHLASGLVTYGALTWAGALMTF
jgi:hypothetical protein